MTPKTMPSHAFHDFMFFSEIVLKNVKTNLNHGKPCTVMVSMI